MAIKKKTIEQDAIPQEVKNEEVSAPKAVSKKEETMPISLVEKLMSEMEEKLSNKFHSQISRLKLEKQKAEMDEDLDYVEELEDDWLDEPVIFFAFSMRYSIHSDRRKGQEVLPPFRPIKFTPLIRHKRPGRGKEVEVVSVSSVKVQSKKEVEYLRNHSLFGIYFYENMENAMNVDSSWAHKMVEAQRSLARLSDMQIVARAKQEGISVSQSPEKMRRELSEILAKRAQDQHEKILNQRLKASVIDEQGRSVTEGKIK